MENNTIKFVIIDISIIYSTSIIDDETCSISIILCPITLRCVIFKDKYILKNILIIQ